MTPHDQPASDRQPEARRSEPPVERSQPEVPALHARASSPEPDSGEEGLWRAYWERFRRQQVDDPVAERREGLWDRFRRQEVDAPVRRSR